MQAEQSSGSGQARSNRSKRRKRTEMRTVERWLQQSQPRREETERAKDSSEPTPTTHRSDCRHHRVRISDVHEDSTDPIDTKKPLKSIMKPPTRVKSTTSSVRFKIPETDQESVKTSCLDACRDFCCSPVCKLIACLLFGILLPCALIYPALLFLSNVRPKSAVASRERLARNEGTEVP